MIVSNRTRIIFAIFWAFTSSFFLWLLSFPSQLPEKPTLGELSASYMHFSFLLFCGGICYHILTEILSTPVTEENRDEWPKLLKLLSYLMISLMSIPAVILLLRDSFNSEWAMPTAFVYLLTYLYLSVVLFIQVGRKFLEIRQSLLSGEKNMPLEEHIKKTRERARKSAKQLLKPLCRDIQEELKKETTLGNPENLIKPDNRDE